MSALDDFPVQLVDVLGDERREIAFRQFCGVVLRNHVESHWCTLDRAFTGPELPASIKQIVRDRILAAVVDSNSLIRKSGCAVAICIARWDWPDEWVALMPLLSGLMSNGDAAISGVVQLLDATLEDVSDTQIMLVHTTFDDTFYALATNPEAPTEIIAAVFRIIGTLLETMCAFITPQADPALPRAFSAALSRWTPLLASAIETLPLTSAPGIVAAAGSAARVISLETDAAEVTPVIARLYAASVTALARHSISYTTMLIDETLQVFDDKGHAVGPAAAICELLILVEDCCARPSVGEAVYHSLPTLLSCLPHYIQPDPVEDTDDVRRVLDPDDTVRGYSLELVEICLEMDAGLPVDQLAVDAMAMAHDTDNWRLAEAAIQLALCSPSSSPSLLFTDATLTPLAADTSPPRLRGAAIAAILHTQPTMLPAALAIMTDAAADETLCAIVLQAVADTVGRAPSDVVSPCAEVLIDGLLSSPVSAAVPSLTFDIFTVISRVAPEAVYSRAGTFIPAMIDAAISEADPHIVQGVATIARAAAHSSFIHTVLEDLLPPLTRAITARYTEEHQVTPALLVLDALLSHPADTLPAPIVDQLIGTTVALLNHLTHDRATVECTVAVLQRVILRSSEAALYPHLSAIDGVVRRILTLDDPRIRGVACPLINTLLGHHREVMERSFTEVYMPHFITHLSGGHSGSNQRHLMVIALVIIRYGVDATLELLGDALPVVLTAWAKSHGDFNGDLDLKLSAIALSTLVESSPDHPALQASIPAKLRLSSGRIVTRSLARRGVPLEVWDPIPFPTKALQVLLDVYREELDQDGLGLGLGELGGEDEPAEAGVESRDPLVSSLGLGGLSTGDLVRERLVRLAGMKEWIGATCGPHLGESDQELLISAWG